MPHLRFALALLLAAAAGAPALANAPTPATIRVATEEWPDATNADGTGLYWDLLRMVYGPEGYALDTTVVTFAQSVRLVQLRRADMMVAAYSKDDFEGLALSARHFDQDHVGVAYKVGQGLDWTGVESLKGRRVGWVKDYGYEKYIQPAPVFQEVRDLTQGVRMLMADRFHYLIDVEKHLEGKVAELAFADKVRVAGLMRLNLHMGFATNERGWQLREVFDRRMAELVGTEEFKALYTKYDTELPEFRAE